jgi:GT2 family glycosyltransferase
MLALIIVYYNKPENLTDFLDSLNKNLPNFTLYIADLTAQLKIANKYSFPITVLPTKNKGYSHGVNTCLKQAQKDHFKAFCVLNYDTTVSHNFTKQVKENFKKYDFFTGKIYYSKGYEFHINRYTKSELGSVIWYAGGLIDWKNALVKHVGVDTVDKGQFNKVVKTDFIPGTLACFNSKVFSQVGYWDSRFFLYYEDADYSVRAIKKGIDLIYDPNLVMWHKNAGSTGGSGSALHIQTQRFSRLLFGLKHAPLRTKIHLAINFLAGNN